MKKVASNTLGTAQQLYAHQVHQHAILKRIIEKLKDQKLKAGSAVMDNPEFALAGKVFVQTIDIALEIIEQERTR